MQMTPRQPTLFIGLGGAGGSIVNRIATILQDHPAWSEFQRVMQFFALDTDKADLDRCTAIPRAHQFAISGFDKGTWVRDKLGRGGDSKPGPDDRVAQWVHDWYNFRATQGVGAGQIRIESRVSLYNCLESTDLIKRLEEAILATIAKENVYVSHDVKRFNIFLYYTVAGGTGSGSHLMMAALLRHLVESMGWGANIIGIAMLSTLVQPVIRNMRQRGDILANGYSAMKEVEHLMRLKVFADLRDPANKRDFVFSPFVSTMELEQSPFDFVYVLDTNPDVYIQDWRTAAADAIYLQLFSPIFHVRNSDYDNYEKNQKRLARGLYSTFYGSYGCSVLTLPDRDLLTYCVMRLTADVIKDYLSSDLVLTLPSGARSYVPKMEELEQLDMLRQDALWDRMFVEFMADRVSLLEGTSDRAAAESPGTLKKHGQELWENGFALALELRRLLDARKRVHDEPFERDDMDRAYDMILPRATRIDVDDQDMMGDDEDPDTSSRTISTPGNILAYLLAFPKTKADLETAIRLESTAAESVTFSAGLFLEFSKLLDRSYLETVGEWCRFTHHQTTRGATIDEGGLEDILDRFGANIRRNLKELTEAHDRARRLTEAIREDLGRRFLAEFFTAQRPSFQVQRLFVLTQREVSRFFCTVLDEVLKEERLSDALDTLHDAIKSIRGDTELASTARVQFSERVRSLFGQGGQEDFQESVRRVDRWVASSSARLSSLIYIQFYRDLHEKIADVCNDAAENLRQFSKHAQAEILLLENEADTFRKNPGRQSEEYHNDIEALQGFDGQRMWGDFYDTHVHGNVPMPEKEVNQTIGAVFADELLATPRDQIDKIRENFSARVHKELEPRIVGLYQEGREKRGLNLQQALEIEAQLRFRAHLKATGRWKDLQEAWAQASKSADGSKLRSRTAQDLYAEMRDFSRRYLECKVASCIRRSSIMANVDVDDVEVTEYSCRQSLICYDQDLYKTPEGGDDDYRTLDFQHLVQHIDSEFIHHDYKDNGKMAIFYQAILGVPVFVFRNLVTSMKEAYNRRVAERDWTCPQKGRQYPLHVDRNWEPGDPGVDPARLPLSIDPEEAVHASQATNEHRCKFFSIWYALYKGGHIIRDEERGFVVPTGKIGNTGPDVRLGRGVRDAVQSLMRAQSAHGVLNELLASEGEPELDEIRERQDFCLSQLGGDVWGNEERDPEIRELADLFREYLDYRTESVAEAEMRKKRAQSFEQCIGVPE